MASVLCRPRVEIMRWVLMRSLSFELARLSDAIRRSASSAVAFSASRAAARVSGVESVVVTSEMVIFSLDVGEMVGVVR